MRIISNEEMGFVSGGLSMAEGEGGCSWFDGVCESIGSWFGSLWGGGGGGADIQTITITGSRMSDVEKIAYDIAAYRDLAPGCSFTYVVNPSSNTIGVSATASLTPSATGSGSLTNTGATKTWQCQP